MAVSPYVRASVYDWLARIFDGSADISFDPARIEASDLSARIAALNQALAGSSIEDVCADHTRLFINAPGGVAAPPYASWYLNRRIAGDAADWVREAYAAQEVEHDPDAGEPPDYLATELEFMFFLCRHEHAASVTGSESARDAAVRAQSAFVADHLARWLPSFITRLRASHPGPVFAAASDLLEATLRTDVTPRSGASMSKAAATRPGT